MMNQKLDGVVGLHFRSVFCIPFSKLPRDVYGCGLIISALFGLIGSVFQLVLWKSYLKRHNCRHKPSSNPHIVFNLALSNALSCLTSVVFGLALLITHKPYENGMIPERISSQDIYWAFAIEFLCDFGYIASAFWSLMYLVDVCLQVHRINCRVIFCYLLCWGLAIFFTVLIGIFKFVEKDSLRKCSSSRDVISTVIVWVTSIFILLLLSSIVLFTIDRQVKIDIYFASNAYASSQRTLMGRVRGKFVFFLVTFFICWLPSIIVGVLHLANYGVTAQKGLSFAEAILHPLQGVFNYFIFTPLRSTQSLQTYNGDRKSPILSRGTIQQCFGTSYESSVSNSMARVPILQSVSSFHFTPCLPDTDSPLVRSYRSTDTLDNVGSNSLENTLNVGCLFGENEPFSH